MFAALREHRDLVQGRRAHHDDVESAARNLAFAATNADDREHEPERGHMPHREDIHAALNLHFTGWVVEPDKTVRARMEYPDDELPTEVLALLDASKELLSSADDATKILDLLNHLSTMRLREATPENRKLQTDWSSKFSELVDSLTRRDKRIFAVVFDAMSGRAVSVTVDAVHGPAATGYDVGWAILESSQPQNAWPPRFTYEVYSELEKAETVAQALREVFLHDRPSPWDRKDVEAAMTARGVRRG